MLPDNGFIGKKLKVVLLILALSLWYNVKAQEIILDSLFTFTEGVVKTGNALNIISRQSGYSFSYDSRLIDPEKETSLFFTNTRLNDILDAALAGDSL